MVHFISFGKECIVILDIDNDGDGSRGEDGERGIDLNRNFPSNWLKVDGRPGGIGEFIGSDADLKRERALLKYQDEEFGSKFFIPWKKSDHPELREGEIGGWIPRYRDNNAFPGETLVGVCDTQYEFEIFRAGLLPDISITDAKARVLYKIDNVKEAIANHQRDNTTIRKGKTKGNSLCYLFSVSKSNFPLRVSLNSPFSMLIFPLTITYSTPELY